MPVRHVIVEVCDETFLGPTGGRPLGGGTKIPGQKLDQTSFPIPPDNSQNIELETLDIMFRQANDSIEHQLYFGNFVYAITSFFSTVFTT